MANKLDTYDVVIVGAGLVGLAAAISLHAQGKRVVLVDAKPKASLQVEDSWDARIYAITPSTEAFLKDIGVWSKLDLSRVNDVEAMALWENDTETPLRLAADDANLPKLACIAENRNMMCALWQQIDALGIAVLMDAPCLSVQHDANQVVLTLVNDKQLAADLLIAADGANSFIRQQLGVATHRKPFNQTALVANYRTEKQHANVARQWFAAHETLALLPLPGQHVSIVWALETELAQKLLGLTDAELVQRVETRSNQVLGQLIPVSETLSFPLWQETATQFIATRVVFVGDAAHRVHPMAGQGANLGFRDVISLTDLIGDSHALTDIGEAAFLRRYERARKADVLSMNTLTSGLDYLFAVDANIVKKTTTFGMQQLNQHASIKRFLIKQAVA